MTVMLSTRFLAITMIALSMTLTVSAQGANAPAPIEFVDELSGFIAYADDLAALRSWYENLTPDEQVRHRVAFEAAVRQLEASEDHLFNVIADQFTESASDSHLYTLFDTIKGMNPIKARTVFSNLIRKVAGRINHDYVSDPSDPLKAQRARDLQAIRSYIGRGTSTI